MSLRSLFLALLLSAAAFASEASQKLSTGEEVIQAPTVIVHNSVDKESTEGAKDYYLPQHEEQVTVYPQKDDDDLLPAIFYPPFYPIQWLQSTTTTWRPTTTRRPLTWPPITTSRPQPPQRPTTTTTPRPGGGADVQVLENYQIISENGIIEYKLRLSNGLVDHKKITKKRIGNKTIYVQTGYYTTPVDPTKNKFDLIFYIADEQGFRVTGVQSCSSQQPCIPRNEQIGDN